MASFRITNEVREKDTLICVDESAAKKINFLSLLFQPFLKIEYNGNVEIVRYVKLSDCNKIEVIRGEFDTAPLNFPAESCIDFYTPNACDKANRLKHKVHKCKRKIKNFIIKSINWLWDAAVNIYCFVVKLSHKIKNFILYLLNLAWHFIKKIFWLIVDLIDYIINLIFRVVDKIILIIKYIWNEIKSIIKWVVNEIKQVVVYFIDKLMCALNGIRLTIDSQLTNIFTVLNSLV
ncbi:MAG: hypothetical protein [Caudoviricetes sp.]|nr:MAG: hypothetical protein [Caudoviricetes sp.]